VLRDDEDQLLDQANEDQAEEGEESTTRQISGLFRGTPELATKFSRGAGLTVRRLGAWWADDKVPRTFLVAGGAYVTSIWSSWAIPAEVGVFVLASLVATETPSAAKPEPGPEPSTPAPAVAVDFARRAEWAVALADLEGRKGIHLADLLAELHEDGLVPEMDTAVLRRALTAAGLPIADQLKLSGSNRPGIRYDDLQQALGRMPTLAPEDVPDLTDDDTLNAPKQEAAA
jgi:hypothetical protein